MLRSRSSGLLPITHATSFPRHDSRNGLSVYMRRRGGSSGMQRVLTYLLLVVLLGGSVYGVARVGRGGSGPGIGAADIDEFAISDALLDNARIGAAAGGAMRSVRQRQQQRLGGRQQQHGHHALHEEAHDRRAALEQHERQQHIAAATQDPQQQHVQQQGATAGQQGAALTQEQLEHQHVQELQHLEQQHMLARQHALAGQQGAAGAAADPVGSGEQPADPVLEAHVAAHIAAQQALPQREGPSLYSANLSAVDIHGHAVYTGSLMGKVTLVVNVASRCGYTEANYQGLGRVYERYKNYGLQVLAFPCNQFGGQEPGSAAEIEAFVASRFRTQFPLMSKVEVNGPDAHPVFAWLKQHTPAMHGHRPGEEVAWNFEKFLLDKYGHPVKRYASALSEQDYHDLELDIYNELIRF